MNLTENSELKEFIAKLRAETKRPDSEILLLARQHDLRDEKEYQAAKQKLTSLTPIDIDQYLHLPLRPLTRRLTCSICFDVFPIGEMFTMDCPASHRFCFECIQGYIRTHLSNGSVCECPDQKCTYEISHGEVKQVFGENSKEYEDYSEALLKRELAKLPVVGCPTPGCKNFIEMDRVRVPMHCVCSGCNAEFCSMCKKDYHYRMNCSESMKYTRDWIEWNTNGRRNYHELLEKEQKKIEGLEKEKKKIEERNQELQRRYQDLVADEKWKEQNCHACPHCGRPIQKLEGCDSMVCGSDYHGGNIQNGCGKRFNWSQSQPYKSTGLSGPKTVEFQPPPNPKQRTRHGDWIPCDNCKQQIVGLRFSCVHCRSFNLCENCEFKVDHHKNHVFRIFEKTEEDEILQIAARAQKPSLMENIASKIFK
uniref:RBR-type E3 ubiquitin transferase n=1 Tax=Arcella intermedia TaxID=1963864 RepID=A0A6B2L4W0_9EUKA